jgi:prephenate dehydrogenase
VTQRPVVGIVGTGLIGGSIGIRCRQNGALVLGYDPLPKALADSVEAGAVDAGVAHDELYERADIVIVAAYVDGTIAELRWLATRLPVRAQLAIDVASVMAPVVQAGAAIPQFVSTHPMAGSERTGARAARGDLFEGKTWAYVPGADESLNGRVAVLISELGGVPYAVDAVEHDAVVAFTSHLPQLIASCYAQEGVLHAAGVLDRLQGSGSKELLRLGRSAFPMWRDVLAANRGNVTRPLRSVAQALLDACDSLESGDVAALERYFRAVERR